MICRDRDVEGVIKLPKSLSQSPTHDCVLVERNQRLAAQIFIFYSIAFGEPVVLRHYAADFCYAELLSFVMALIQTRI